MSPVYSNTTYFFNKILEVVYNKKIIKNIFRKKLTVKLFKESHKLKFRVI